MANYQQSKMDVHSQIDTFDRKSGSLFERILFNNRGIFLFLCLVATIIFGHSALNARVSADYDQMIPTHQSFIVNYLKHYRELQSQANAVEISVTANSGGIFNTHYLSVLRRINDEVYLLPGVDRPFMTSLWTPNTRWIAVTADGLDSGPVIPETYDGSLKQLEVVRRNTYMTGEMGKLVSSDLKSSMIYVPLMETNNLTGKPLDYGNLARRLNAIRNKYANQGVTLRIIGFAMVMGDMINGIDKVLVFFGVSILVATLFLFGYTRCVRSTLLVVLASLTAVVWQMGILVLMGYSLTPYSVLVPFLIFAIGTSHGAQKMNGVMQDIGRGTHPLVAARYTFRRLFMAGFAALLCDMASFAVLMTIQIVAIRQLATIASVGVGLLVITNLMMLPIMLSFTGVSKKAAARSLKNTPAVGKPHMKNFMWRLLDKFTRQNYAIGAVVLMIVLGGMGWYVGRDVQVGDLHSGAPELRQDSQYNRDNAFIVKNFTTGSDTFIVLTDTPEQGCLNYDMLVKLNALQWKLDQLPVVQSTNSIASFASYASMLMTEGAPKWYGIEPNQSMLNGFVGNLPSQLSNYTCSFAPVYVSLKNHEAKTLDAVVSTVKKFINNPHNQGPNFKMSMAGGNAGIAAATNIVVKQANLRMLLLVYAVVVVFCFVAFRSWRAVICAVLPLTITSLMAEALMVWLGIGVKVATLPVVALGVGIGVDYALYVLSIMLKNLRQGQSLSDAYYNTLLFTGRVVILTGITLATGVATWIFAPIKFQADMGLLLSFMFLWNMFGAMVFLPALAYFLLPQRLFAPTEEELMS